MSTSPRPRTVVTRAAALLASVVLTGVAGCSADTGERPEPSPSTRTTAPTAQGVRVPDGLTLTEPGSTLRVGEPAYVVYRAGKKQRSVVRVTVTRIRKGTMKHFEHFSLGSKPRRSTPYYVDVTIRNKGPGRLGRAAVPVYGYDSSDAYFPPAELVGEFKRCRGGALPKHFRPGDKVSRCLVFLVPPKANLRSVQVRTGRLDAPISWRRPRS